MVFSGIRLKKLLFNFKKRQNKFFLIITGFKARFLLFYINLKTKYVLICK